MTLQGINRSTDQPSAQLTILFRLAMSVAFLLTEDKIGSLREGLC
jgi:hypothetical protein